MSKPGFSTSIGTRGFGNEGPPAEILLSDITKFAGGDTRKGAFGKRGGASRLNFSGRKVCFAPLEAACWRCSPASDTSRAVQWSPEQERALAAVAAWLKARDRPVFRLFGYAGTGKTTLARHVADSVKGDAVFAAFTGKAAHVMRNKGCRDAGTIHSLIYRPQGEEEEVPTFVLNEDSAAGKAALIVIDECSMVDEEVGRDLLSFGVPSWCSAIPPSCRPSPAAGFSPMPSRT